MNTMSGEPTKNQIYFFTGPCAYAKVFRENRDLKGFEDKYVQHEGMYSISVGLNDEDSDIMMGFNRRYEPKSPEGVVGLEDVDPGLQFFPFRRKHLHLSKKGEPIKDWGGPPVVLTKDLEPWPEKTLIGNGSIVTVKVIAAPNPRARGSFVRLESIRVDSLVEYNDPNDAEVTKGPEDGLPF